MKGSKKAVGVLKKAFDILSGFQFEPNGMTLASIAQLARINISTAHRLLSQMEGEGFLQRADNGRYRIGQRLFHLGMLAPLPLNLGTAATTALATLARETGETANLAILERAEILVINVIESSHDFRMAARVGGRRPFYTTALGKAIAAFLAGSELKALLENLPTPLEAPTPNSIHDLPRLREELDTVRTRGYALDNQEAVFGARAIAAPVFNGNGKVEGAISMSGPYIRITEQRIPAIASSVVKA